MTGLLELERARGLLHDQRLAVAEVAYQGSVGAQGVPHAEIDKGNYPADPSIDPHLFVLTEHTQLPIFERQLLEGYDGIYIQRTEARIIDHPMHVPSVSHEVKVDYHRDGETFDESAQITNTGDVIYRSTVNTVPPRRRKDLTRGEKLWSLRRRTAEGLVVARFAVDALQQVHGVPNIPTGRLDEIEERLTNAMSMPLGEIPMRPGIATLVPQTRKK